MQKYRKAGYPVESDEGMRSWYAGLAPETQAKLTPEFRGEILKCGASSKPPGTLATDADYKTFEAAYKPEAGDQTVLADLKKQLAFYMFKHRAASELNDGPGASEAMRQIKELASVVHDSELRAQKLGRDMGDLVPRKELEVPARFLGYHLLRCADAALSKLAKAITEREPNAPPITPEEVRRLGEPLLLTALVYDPMAKAMAGDNGAAPPDWLLAAMKDGLAEVVEP